MNSLNALDLVASIFPRTETEVADEPETLNQATFALICAAESFELVVSEKFKVLAQELSNASNNLFKCIDSGMILSNNTIVHPDAKYVAFERYEKLFLCINTLVDEICEEEWRAQIAWRNIQAYSRAVKNALVRSLG